jgi:hypothetical protein
LSGGINQTAKLTNSQWLSNKKMKLTKTDYDKRRVSALRQEKRQARAQNAPNLFRVSAGYETNYVVTNNFHPDKTGYDSISQLYPFKLILPTCILICC